MTNSEHDTNGLTVSGDVSDDVSNDAKPTASGQPLTRRASSEC